MMKLKALKKFHCNNRIRGTWEALKVGDEFEMDPKNKEDAQEIFEIIAARAAVPIDSEFIPESGKYLCQFPFQYKDADGRAKDASPQSIIILGREDAAKFMSSAHVIPTDVGAWRPQNLLNLKARPKDEKVKSMYDDDEPAPVSTVDLVRNHKVRGAI